MTYDLLGDDRKAGQYYCKAMESSPMHDEAHYNLGLMLKHLNQPKYAIDELEKAAVLSSGRYSSHSKYIFDVLSEVTLQMQQKGEDKSIKDKIKLNEPEEQEQPLILVNGKVTSTEEAEVAILENFRKCKSKELFEVN